MVPRELYTLGAVKFDTQPLAKLQGELMAKKAAKEEALDKWIFDLQGKIPSGQVRAIDREPFQQKVAQWIKDGIAAKGKPGAQQSILEGFQSLLADANESKAAGERQQKIAEIRLQNPDKVDEEDLPIIDRMSKSIYDPLFYKKPEIRQPFTLEDFSANIPTWDVGKRKQFIDFAISGVKPVGKVNEKSVYDKPSFTDITTYDEVFTPQQIKDVSQKAIAVLSDRSGLKTYKNILKEGEQQTPSDQFISLAKAYELVNPGDVMNTPLKVAQADVALSMIGAKETKTISRVNREALAKYQSDLIASRGGGEKKTSESFVDYWAEIESKPTKIVGNASNPKQQVQGIPVKDLTATPQKRVIDIANSITGEKFGQGDLILQKLSDGKIHILEVLYGKEKDKAGNLFPIGVKDIVPINPEDINLKPQIDVQSRRKAVEEAKKAKANYTIGGKQFTRQQIEQGAKAYGMTVEEYLASFENE